MSSASTSRTIKFISKSGTYTAYIMSPSGDIYQEFPEDGGTPFPDFHSISVKPELNLVCTSSRPSEGVNGIVTPENVEYFFNGKEIVFPVGGGASTDSQFARYFTEEVPSETNRYFKLKITDNLVELGGRTSITIGMKAYFKRKNSSNADGTTVYDTIQANYNIEIKKQNGEGYRVNIKSGPGSSNGFLIDDKTDVCELVAEVYRGTQLVPSSSLTYEWRKMGATGWGDVISRNKSITVHESDIGAYGEYKVDVSLSSGGHIGSDTQEIWDVTDNLYIVPNPAPEDETIVEGDGSKNKVTYTPELRSRKGSTVTTKFFFVKTDASGKVLGNSSVAVASFSVYEQDCVKANGDVSLTITSEV